MDVNQQLFPNRSTRIGFHYFQDTVHYRESDLSQWIPELSALGASWLVVKSDPNRAIPEAFLTGLIAAGIEPLVDFKLALTEPTSLDDLSILFKAYARWGVHGIILFDRPNAFSSWGQANWSRQDLAERFLDRYLPIAEAAADMGLIPILPPLEPGGSYWDTSFLGSMLTSLSRRASPAFMEQVVLSAYGFTPHRDINWGAGGPQRWPEAHPYFTPDGQQNQIGFRVFDWYLDVSRSILQRECPIILLGAGSPGNQLSTYPINFTSDQHSQLILNIVNQLEPGINNSEDSNNAQVSHISDKLIACNFWLLADDQQSESNQAWFSPLGTYTPTVTAMKDWYQNCLVERNTESRAQVDDHHPLLHYLLLPKYEWGVSDWHLDVIKPFVKKHLPTVGFSLADAALARQVTIIGEKNFFSDEDVEKLILSGCQVSRIIGDGTSIASQLAER